MANLEVCIDSAAGLDACVRAGPARVELCSALALGGLTPGYGLMKLAGQTSLCVYAMIRPRAGDFVFTDKEVSIMCDDINIAAEAGMSGVVLGAANPNPSLNVQALQKMVRTAGSLGKTLHRVIDTLNNPLLGMEVAIDLGFDRILSSGGKPSAEHGTALLNELREQSAGRIDVMAGSGLTPELVKVIFKKTGITSFHSSCTRVASVTGEPSPLGFSNASLRQTDSTLITQYLVELNKIELQAK